MYVYAIPLASAIVFGTQLESLTQGIQKKVDQLSNRYQATQSHFEETKANKNWNFETLGRLTTLSLDLPDLCTTSRNFTQWEPTISHKRAEFNDQLGYITIPRPSNSLAAFALISTIAQITISGKAPLSTLHRILPVIATIALPILFFQRFQSAVRKQCSLLRALDPFTKSHPLFVNCRFVEFVLNGNRFKQTHNTEFNENDIEQIAESLFNGKFPEGILSNP